MRRWCDRRIMPSGMLLHMTEYREYWGAPYREMLDLQHEIFNRRVDARHCGKDLGEDYLLMVTHNPVYTLGRHADPGNIVNREWLEERGAEVVEIDRGGDVTFHGPGQLVAYPIIDLQSRKLGVRDYVNLLEEAVIRTIAEYGIKGERVEGATGVWIDAGTPSERKICAIGIRCSRFITMHGLALNVSTDMSWFSAINPCGFVDKGVTSIALEMNRLSQQEATDKQSGVSDMHRQTLDIQQVATRLRHHLSSLLYL